MAFSAVPTGPVRRAAAALGRQGSFVSRPDARRHRGARGVGTALALGLGLGAGAWLAVSVGCASEAFAFGRSGKGAQKAAVSATGFGEDQASLDDEAIERAKVRAAEREAIRAMSPAPTADAAVAADADPLHATDRLMQVPKDIITELILDASGSMKQKLQNRTKLYQAKRVLKAFMMEAHTDNMVLGLRVYGMEPRNCKSTKLVLDFGEKGVEAIDGAMQAVDPEGYGKTPLARSLLDAEEDLKKHAGKPKRIIVVTDGMETCGGDPCKIAKELAEKYDIRIFVVGYALDEQDREKLKCLSDVSKGKYWDAMDLNSLLQALRELSNLDKNLFVKSPDPLGISELWQIGRSGARTRVKDFVSSIGVHAEPGVEYEVVVKLDPAYRFGKVTLARGEKKTLVVRGNGLVDIGFMNRLFTIQLLNEHGKAVATFASDTPTSVPTGMYKVKATAAPFAETTIDDITVVPGGKYAEAIKGFGAVQINASDRGPGPFGIYVFDDRKKQDIGSYLTGMPMVLPMSRYTLKSVGNAILRNVYPEPAKVLEIPLPPPGQTVTFARREKKEEIEEEEKAAAGRKGPVMLDSLTPEQIKRHLEEKGMQQAE